MRLLKEWQYKFVERSLKDYYILKQSETETNKNVCKAIEQCCNFFKGTQHEMVIQEFYFNHIEYEKKYTLWGHHIKVFEEMAGRTSANGYFVRKEIVYKVAMYLYALNVFKFEDNDL